MKKTVRRTKFIENSPVCEHRTLRVGVNDMATWRQPAPSLEPSFTQPSTGTRAHTTSSPARTACLGAMRQSRPRVRSERVEPHSGRHHHRFTTRNRLALPERLRTAPRAMRPCPRQPNLWVELLVRWTGAPAQRTPPGRIQRLPRMCPKEQNRIRPHAVAAPSTVPAPQAASDSWPPFRASKPGLRIALDRISPCLAQIPRARM